MRDNRYMAGLGTVLLFIGFYCLKAALQKKQVAGKENEHHPTTISKRTKLIWLLAGVVALAGGAALIIKALKLIYL